MRKAKRTNCQMATGDDTKLLLHNSDFYKHLSAKAVKKPKGNGIKDGFCVSWLCLCRSLLVFFVRSVRWAAVAIFAEKKHIGKSCINLTGREGCKKSGHFCPPSFNIHMAASSNHLPARWWQHHKENH